MTIFLPPQRHRFSGTLSDSEAHTSPNRHVHVFCKVAIFTLTPLRCHSAPCTTTHKKSASVLKKNIKMDWTALLKTLGLCLISIIIEAFSATKDGKKWFEDLRQPKYSFPFSFWYVIGGLYYIICGIIAYTHFHSSTDIFTLPIILLTLIMVINGLTNFILFKFRSLKMFYLILYPFSVLFIGLIIVLIQTDKISVVLAGVYLAWLVYDLYYFLNLWRLNNRKTGEVLPESADRHRAG